MKAIFHNIIIVFCLLLLINLELYSQTTLAVGDIAFTAMNTDGNLTAAPFDYFSIVAFVPISAGTQIRFSDVQYRDATGFATSNGVSEFEFVWTAPAGGIAYMEQVTFWATGTVAPPAPNTDKGTVSGSGLSLTIAGDQIFAVQGASMNSGTIIAGIHNNVSSVVTTGPSNWDDGCSVSTSESELPNGLTNGVNAIWVYNTGPVEVDNAIFNGCGSVSSSFSAAANRTIINDIANWIKDDSNTFSTPPCGSTLPVEISAFEGYLSANNVLLNWETATETNNYGFEILRYAQNDTSWNKVGFVQGHGTTNSPKNYKFTDSVLPTVDKVSYRLKQIDTDGSFEYSKIIAVEKMHAMSLPYEFRLEQNYPNPFNPTTTIKFGLPIDSYVKLEVFNILGEKVAVLADKKMLAGYHQVNFDGANLSSGIYIYKITAGDFVSSKKLLLMK
ncbi:MAG: T9SS type A sorting domain-containing protein [bacterium]